MSWFAKLLSPNKRRGSDETGVAQPTKKAKSLLRTSLFGTQTSTPLHPFEKDGIVSFDAKSGSSLGPLLLSSLVPRPLVLVTSLDHNGDLTIAPSSFCTLISEDPAYISVSLEKDSLPSDSLTEAASSVVDSKEFTVSIVSKWLAEAATKTAGSYRDFKPDLEADLARSGISTAASVQVAVPRVAEAAVSLECRMKNRVIVKDKAGEVASTLVIAEVVCVLVNKGVVSESAEGAVSVDIQKLAPVAVIGDEQGGEVANLYPLPLKPMNSIQDEIPPAGPEAAEEPLAVHSEHHGEHSKEEIAAAVATAVAETLSHVPDAPLVEDVHVVLKEQSAAVKSKSHSLKTNRSATARSREATPISMIK